MYYVSMYERYPIYEPAEGGYYYSGLQLVESERMSKRKAVQMIKELAKEAEECEGREFNIHIHGVESVISERSKYIGEGIAVFIEKKCGSKTCGYRPYC